MAIDQSSLWLQYMQTLSASITLGGGEAVQAVYPFQEWNWGGQSPILGSYSYDQWATLNVVPSVPYLNGNTSPASQSGFDTGYAIWFNALESENLQKEHSYVLLQSQLREATNKLMGDRQNVENVFLNQTKGTGVTFDKWLAETAHEGYALQLGQDKAKVANLEEQIAEYQKRISTPLKAMRTAFENAEFQGLTTDPNSGKAVSLRIWATTPRTPWEHLQAITNENFEGPAVAGNRHSFSLNESSSHYNYNEYYGEAGGGVWDDFIGIGAAGSYHQIDWSTFAEEYRIDFQFEDFARVQVMPRQWYAGTNIAGYGAGPYMKGWSAYKTGQGNYFFGPGGALSRIYTDLIVAYRPTVTITAGAQFASYLHQQWEAEVGIEIGPFFFGGKGSGEHTESSATLKEASLTLESKANWPVIVAMCSAWTYQPSGAVR